MVTSPNKFKIPEWDEKFQNKQTDNKPFSPKPQLDPLLNIAKISIG